MQTKKLLTVLSISLVLISVAVCSFSLLLTPNTKEYDTDVFTIQIPYMAQATEGKVNTISGTVTLN